MNNEKSEGMSVGLSYKSLLVDPNYYMILVGNMVYILRRKTFIAWLGSGWPEWVASESDPSQFNQDINRLQSIVSFSLLFVGLIPGFWLDFCRIWWRKQTNTYGDMIGLGSSYCICGVTMIVASILQAEQIETAAYASVIIHNIGRCFGVLWNPLYFYLFPVELYGFIFGSVSLVSQIFGLVNLPMLSYNTANDDYAIMNYILGGMISLIGIVAIACYRKYRSSLKPDQSNVSDNSTKL